ncbi:MULTISPECIES: ZIP family metal transporter [Variovorax]|mgnify:CR=1 FL=1|jgi:zinc transporter, ZIP family|uniref:ZIP family metal transporter n=1 Tax=Variovorax TaxID=34072 RepID=UPI00086CDEAC|nr:MULTISPECIES: ZIP family metal transporter [Variovorax]MBN8754900.1 ZIP family metal transporter [Variovorax sp.]ODU11710.1 MAG: divalent cation transporter [Variovorax sp. SCN 67-85]ODV14926.1 MAG: divalent cation transporter [Variovorax sp. SCN 67-20]OJZ05356.1 MAG: ZIP family metal transporter [Variovorax sp. 67-131]UKI05199.1 ZIP family metal transporter [Variovorax paradoxus]
MNDPRQVTVAGTRARPGRPMREWIGLAIVAAGALVGLLQFWTFVRGDPIVWNALLGGSVAALATALGTLPMLFSQKLPDRLQDTLFGFGAGVMLAASAFSLIIPGLEAARNVGVFGGGSWAAGGVIGSAILLGGAALMLMDRVLPHEHFIKGREGQTARQLRRTWLFVFAIALHNVPEGLAIGVGYAANNGLRADALATGIAIQDVPEGLVVAVALLAAGYSRIFAVLIGMASGLVEPLGAVLGAAVVGHSAMLLPWGLGFAAGAMLFVISHEIIPESHRKGHEAFATSGLMIGFVLMMLLDTALG